jgi:hypothetical protein
MASTRLMSFNVENMFDRPKAMSRDGANQAPRCWWRTRGSTS